MRGCEKASWNEAVNAKGNFRNCGYLESLSIGSNSKARMQCMVYVRLGRTNCACWVHHVLDMSDTHIFCHDLGVRSIKASTRPQRRKSTSRAIKPIKLGDLVVDTSVVYIYRRMMCRDSQRLARSVRDDVAQQPGRNFGKVLQG
jgi:hypothetical protein